MGIPLYDLHDAFISHPLGQKIDGELFINSPQKINHDPSITFYSEFIPNKFIDVLGLGDTKQIMAGDKRKDWHETQHAAFDQLRPERSVF